MLQVRLLGQFDVRLDGKRVAITSRAGQSLFAYLTLTAGTSHRREKLAGIIWPNTTDENARKNLRQELWRIRKALSTQTSTKRNYLLTDDLTLKFDRHMDFWLDVTQIEKSDSDLQALITNLSLYQGELLPGFYDEWVALERERIQALFDARMEQLLKQLINAEHWIAVQEWGERWLSLAGTREPAYRALMLASGARGDMAKASSLYQRCLAELQDLLGVEPSAETLALYDGLVKGAKKTPYFAVKPSSTITFLFTDIEGSTHLLERMGAKYAAVLSEHHGIIRKAIQNWNGHEVDTQGDAFFVTFPRALDAVQCAAETQRALASHSWKDGEQVRVRMGLHTGEPLIASTGYVGMDVHRAARIGDAGHGGQVLLSQTTRELVIQDLPKEIAIRDLGEYRLKDMKYPTAIYQLVIDGLPADFPPIRTKITGTEAPMPGKAPFKGLEYFDEQDSDLFFGRETLTEKMVRRLKDAKSLSVIIGASGSGKSSLVRAGLVPTIKNQNPDWTIHILTPTAHPLDALAIELTRESESVTATATLADDLSNNPHSLHYFLSRRVQHHGTSPHILLVIDQFEELFTLCHDEFEREAFVDNLLACFNRTITTGERKGGEDCNLMLVITLRADFYAHLSQYPELRDAVAQEQEYIGPMTMDELHRATEEPARKGYWEFEAGLVDLILRDAGEEPGALPLLSHALLETWQRRAGHVMTLMGYADAGGVHGAIAHTADNVFNSMSSSEQMIVRNILLRLTEFGEGTEDTRRRASFDELMSQAESAGDVRNVLNKLAEARLVTLSEDTAEVAHEALIREWPQLREWLTQDREGIILHRHITEAAHEWELLEQDPGSLYHGARLAQANEWSALNPDALNAQERLFLDESNRQVKEEEIAREEQRIRETRLKQRVQRVLQVLAGVFLIAAIVSGGLAFWANSQRQEALTQSAILLAQRAETELANGYHDRAVLLALTALENYPYTSEAEHALGQAVSYNRALGIYNEHSSAVTSVAWSPDGKLVASSTSSNNNVHIWNPDTGETVLVIDMPVGITGNKLDMTLHVQWTPDGKNLLTMTGDRYTLGSQDYDVLLWDATTSKLISSIEVANEAAPESGDLNVTFVNYPTGSAAKIAPKSGRLATLGGDNTALIWDMERKKIELVLSGHTKGVNSVDWSPDEEKLVTASLDGTVRVWNSQTGDVLFVLEGHEGRVNIALWSRDGLQLATAGVDGAINVWNENGELLHSIEANAGEIGSLVWEPNGKRIVSGHVDGSIRIWNVETGKLLETIRGHQGNISDLKWSPVDDRIISSDGNGFVRIWNMAYSTAWRLYPPQAKQEVDWTVQGVSWSNDGHNLVMAGGDPFGATDPPTFSIWNVDENNLIRENLGDKLNFMGLMAYYSPDNKSILYLGFSGFPDFSGLATAYVFDTQTGEIIKAFTPGGDNLIRSIAWAPDGTQIATGLFDNQIIIWDYQTGNQIIQLVHGTNEAMAINYVEWSKDGSKLASASDESTARVWDAKTWEPLYTVQHPPPAAVITISWSPDNTRLLTTGGNDELGAKDTTARIWDSATGKELLVFANHTMSVWPGSWSPDGKRVVTTGNEGTVRTWDTTTGDELLTLSVPVGYGLYAWWSPDGKHIAIAGHETLISVWNVWQTKEELIDYAKECCIVRELTPEERQQFGLP